MCLDEKSNFKRIKWSAKRHNANTAKWFSTRLALFQWAHCTCTTILCRSSEFEGTRFNEMLFWRWWFPHKTIFSHTRVRPKWKFNQSDCVIRCSTVERFNCIRLFGRFIFENSTMNNKANRQQQRLEKNWLEISFISTRMFLKHFNRL